MNNYYEWMHDTEGMVCNSLTLFLQHLRGRRLTSLSPLPDHPQRGYTRTHAKTVRTAINYKSKKKDF